MPDMAASEALSTPTLSSIAATMKTEGATAGAKLDATEKRRGDTLDKMLAASPPPAPEIDKPQAPPPAPPQNDPFQAFGSPAGWIAAFGSLLSRRPLVTALNSATAVMQAAKQNDEEAFKRHHQIWKENSEYAQQLADWQMNRYQAAFDKYKDDQDKLNSTLSVMATQDKNTVMQHALKTGDSMTIWNAFEDQNKRVAEMGMRQKELAERLNRPSMDREEATAIEELVKKGVPRTEAISQVKSATTTGAYDKPVEVEVTDADGKVKRVLAQQHKMSGQWTTADEKHTPITGVTNAGKAGLQGSRESVFNQRILISAREAARDLENVVNLPTTASTGLFGGRQQGPSLMDATHEVMANTMTSQEVQSYNVMATGFQRSLATIEASGLAAQGTLTKQMDTVLFKEGDTNLTKLQKLAQIRQIVEAGLDVLHDNPRVSEKEREKADQIIKSLQESVPFTQGDLLKLQIKQSNDPKATLRSFAESLKGGGGIDAKAKEAWGSYEPDKYDYRLNDGVIQRRAKDG